MKLFLCPNKNETPPIETCDVIYETTEWTVAGARKEPMRIAHALLPIDLFLDANPGIYRRLRDGEDVEIEIKESE